MDIRLERLIHTPDLTLGVLHIRYDGDAVWVRECFTKEPPVRADRVYVAGESALPVGRYNVSLSVSRRYSRVVPLVVGSHLLAPGGHRIALGMRIVPGHFTLDTESGIVVGQTQGPKDVHQTRQAFEAIFAKFEAAKNRTEAIDLEIV